MKLYTAGWGQDQETIEEFLKDYLESDFSLAYTKEDYPNIILKNMTFKKSVFYNSGSDIKALQAQKKSVLAKAYADIYLVTKNTRGATKEKKVASNVKIASYPQLLNSSGTFLVNGTEYTLVNQLRKKSGAYTSSTDSGSPILELNFAKGRNASIIIDDASSTIKYKMGSSTIPIKAFAVLLGLTRPDFEKALGSTLTKANWDKYPDMKLKGFYRRIYKLFYEYKQENLTTISDTIIEEDIKKYFKSMQFDGLNMQNLYGKNISNFDKKTLTLLLETFHKLLKGEDLKASPDELYHQKLFSPAKLFTDRLDKLHKEIASKVKFQLQKAKSAEDYKRIMTDIFTQPLTSLVTQSNLARLDPQYNILSFYSRSNLVTPMGIGGINDAHAVKMGARATHFSQVGIIDPIATPQGGNIGLQVTLIEGVKTDKEGNIFKEFTDKKGKNKFWNIADIKNKYVALPGQDKKKGKVDAIHAGKLVTIPKSKVDLSYKEGTDDVLNDINMIAPFPQAVQGNRNLMNYRFMGQALPLKYREKPFVRTVDNTGTRMSSKIRKKLEKVVPRVAPCDGIVKKISNNTITIKDSKGKTHDVNYHTHLAFSTNTGLHQRVLSDIKPGAHVKKGQALLRDSYTDKDGDLALSVNLKTTYTPYYGYNTEDGVVITETAAKKLTSIHYYKTAVNTTSDYILDLKQFRTRYGQKYESRHIDFNKYDEEGIIKKGSEVAYKDPLAFIIQKVTPDDKMETLGKISRNLIVNLKDGTVVYKHRTKGVVIDVNKSKGVTTLTIKTEELAIVGDKIAGAYGNKGTISTILKDEDALVDASGDKIDVIWSPTAVPSRMNPGQIAENILSKAAKKRGKAYEVSPLNNPNGKALNKFVLEEAKKHKVSGKEKVYDPKAKRFIKNKLSVGYTATFKQLKAEKDLAARGVGPSYTSLKQPAKGGAEGAKSFGAGEFGALQSHNVRHIINEAIKIKGESNPEFWDNYEKGITQLPTGNSFGWNSATALMTVAGGHVTEDSKGTHIDPVTTHTIKKLTGQRTVKQPGLLYGKSLKPIKDGLFDPATTGGLDGNLWSKIKLEDSIISPMTTGYIAILLDLKGDSDLKEWQANHTKKEMTSILKKINIDNKLKELAKRAKEKKLDNKQIKLYKFLKNLKEKNIKLEDLVLDHLLVPPPKYRPLLKLDNGDVQLHDLNLFYKDVMISNDNIKSLKGSGLEHEAKADLIDNVNALVGKSDSKNRQLRRKGAKGVLKALGGDGSPKEGMIFSKLILKKQDMTGRGRIIADPTLDMDTIGVPESALWKLTEPHIRKTLKQSGMNNSQIKDALITHNTAAKAALDKVIKEVPALYNRAPTLHKGSILAAHIKPVKGINIHYPLFSTEAQNADFDGDAIQLHIPATPAAINDAKKMMLSNNLLSEGRANDVMAPAHSEAVLGFYLKTLEDRKQVVKDLKQLVPEYKVPTIMKKKDLKELLTLAAKNHKAHVTKIYSAIQKLGFEYATEIGLGIDIEDLNVSEKEKEKILKKYLPKIDKETDKLKRAKLLEQMQTELLDKTSKILPKDNPFKIMMDSGAKGKSNQVTGILATPAISYITTDPINTANPVSHSYSEGLPMREFLEQNQKARQDSVVTFTNVSVPGTISKLLLGSTHKIIITEKDCKTHNGIIVEANSESAHHKCLAESVGKYKRNTMLTSEIQSKIGNKKIKVRSPMYCESQDGVCQYCYGGTPEGKLPELGMSVGVTDIQTVSEPITQMGLDAKHGGHSITRDIGQGGLTDLSTTLSSHEDARGSAVISKTSSKVSSIETLPSGATKITMEDDSKYIIPRVKEVIVKKGQTVKKAAPLTKGIIPFTEVTKLKGITAGRKALYESGRDILHENMGGKKTKAFELVAKGTLSSIKVLSNFHELSIGDEIPYNKFLTIAKKYTKSKAIKDVEPGMFLGKEVDDYSAGHKLDESDIKDLAENNITLPILDGGIIIEPIIKTPYTAGLVGDDWVDHLSLRSLKSTLVKATAEGKVSPEKSTSMISKWIKGKPVNTVGPYF